MDEQAKKVALRMIPYGLYLLSSETSAGTVAVATVNWVTQASFDPPLVAVGVKVGSRCHEVIRESGVFALNVLGKGQGPTAYAFFKPVERDGTLIGGEEFTTGESGAPLLVAAPAVVECNVVGSVAEGDHTLFVGRVVAASVRDDPPGRPDDATLWLRDLGEKIFYGG